MRTPLASLIPILLVATSLAGCFSDPKPSEPSPSPSRNPMEGFVDPMVPHGDGHDHAKASQHDFAFHMKLLSHDALGGNAVRSSGAHAVDVQKGWLFVATYGMQLDVSGGLYIFNLSNPEKPNLVGQLRLPGNLGGDRSMEATDDAAYVVLGTEAADCAGHVSITPPGTYLVDVRDKAAPKILDVVPGTGTHSVIVHHIGDDDYVFTLGGNPNIYKLDRAAGKLKGVGQVQIKHDAAIYDDPVLKVPILYVANIEDFVVYDVSDPAHPDRLGEWQNQDTKNGKNYVHAVAVDWIQGQRIVVIESEDWEGHLSPVWILNATDLDDLSNVKATTWTNPGNHTANDGVGGSSPASNFEGQLIFSTHNPRVENGTIYLAHYHGGAWMIDINTLDKVAKPEVLGYYLPHNDNGGFVPRSGEGAYPKPNLLCGFEITQVPLVFDLEVQGGIVYALDLHTGLYVLKRDDSVLPAKK